MRKIILLISLIFCGCFNIFTQTKLTQSEYDVYASVLKFIYKEYRETYSNKSEFVFLKETKIDTELDLPSEIKYKSLVKDFTRKNKIQTVIEKRFPRGAYSNNYYLVLQTEVDELLEKGRIELERRHAEVEELNALNPSKVSMVGGNDWTPFFRKYPESSGLHTLSRVGFSGQFALLQVQGNHGWTGFSRTYILKKVNKKWKIISADGSEWIT